MFSTLPKPNFYFSVTFILLSANAFNLDQSKNLLFGNKVFLYEIILTFNNPERKKPFPTMFSMLLKTNIIILATYNLIWSLQVLQINGPFITKTCFLKAFKRIVGQGKNASYKRFSPSTMFSTLQKSNLAIIANLLAADNFSVAMEAQSFSRKRTFL